MNPGLRGSGRVPALGSWFSLPSSRGAFPSAEHPLVSIEKLRPRVRPQGLGQLSRPVTAAECYALAKPFGKLDQGGQPAEDKMIECDQTENPFRTEIVSD
jgi:hypothetical protein